MSVLNAAHFHDEEAAFAKLESIVWPNGPECPHCSEAKRIYTLKGVRTKPSKKNPEGVERPGLKKCGACRKQFTVRVGTVFESSHIPLHKWFQAVHLLCSSKKGISSHQLHRILEIKYESAWFMSHRLREAMRTGSLAPMGGGGGVVEVDETYTGKSIFPNMGSGTQHKLVVLTLVERDGEARSFHIDRADTATIVPIVEANIAKEAKVASDDAGYYRSLKGRGYDHATVSHRRGEYVRGEVHSNTVEGYFSIFKRGMKGVYQHCSEKHLHRYLAEFDFRYSNRSAMGVEDAERTVKALQGIKGKRLTYRGRSSASE
jgi:transposase-like protein